LKSKEKKYSKKCIFLSFDSIFESKQRKEKHEKSNKTKKQSTALCAKEEFFLLFQFFQKFFQIKIEKNFSQTSYFCIL
jgi:hypothetical protein